jgi:hypothetical protein
MSVGVIVLLTLTNPGFAECIGVAHGMHRLSLMGLLAFVLLSEQATRPVDSDGVTRNIPHDALDM